MTIPQMAERLDINPKTIRERLTRKNLFVKNYNHNYSEEDFKKISYNKYCEIKKRCYLVKKHTEKKILVIEYYQQNENNTAPKIAKELNLKLHFCEKAITEYLSNNKTITVESKINLPDEE